jgi:F-type H+-transporting ATPase subunit gamma
MPSLKAIRTRIASVKNTQKITKAMKLVAAARLRRAQDAVIAARPYAERMAEVLADVSTRLAQEVGETHPLMTARPIKVARLIVVTSDRGLAGGFNSNLNRRVERFLVDEKPKYPSVELAVVGRKGREHWKRRINAAHSPYAHASVTAEYPGPTGDTALDRAREIAQQAVKDFLDGKVDAILVAYNEFKSAISQVVRVETLLPIPPKSLPEGGGRLLDFEYEPSKAEVLTTLVPLYLEVELYRVMLESIASEFGARMSAMDNATKNAKEMIGSLTLQFNRARQAAITKELMEIVGGAEALKG